VKSHLRDDGIEQMLRILREFHDFFPGHAGKKVYGILAAVSIPEDVEKRVLREGIYLARIHDENFEISVPEDFQPRAY
jgi:RecB family endonuclease NucS